MKLFLVFFALLLCSQADALDNGAANLPPLGWSTWNAFKLQINETVVRESAAKMASSPLKAAGYEYILIDDGWTKCEIALPHDGTCLRPWPRDKDTHRMVPDMDRFPSGMKNLSDYVHSLGLKIGIYTAVSATTCGGYTGSLGYEKIDAETFAEWEMDFVKYDTCNSDCPVHNGCMIKSAQLLRDSLNATGRSMVYYLDAGNPTSGQKMYNPHNYHVTNKEIAAKVGVDLAEVVWTWGGVTANMFKSWFDRDDYWESMLSNVHNQIQLGLYQSCGSFNMPDYLCTGAGNQQPSQYRAEFFLWAILGAPLIVASDIRTLDSYYIDLLTNKEILAIDQDPDCTQGSLVSAFGASEVWMRPLHDQSFACTMINKGNVPANITVFISHKYITRGDFYPAYISRIAVRDVYKGIDLGSHSDTFTYEVGPMDGAIFRFKPVW